MIHNALLNLSRESTVPAGAASWIGDLESSAYAWSVLRHCIYSRFALVWAPRRAAFQTK